jgi:hypothetical protein
MIDTQYRSGHSCPFSTDGQLARGAIQSKPISLFLSVNNTMALVQSSFTGSGVTEEVDLGLRRYARNLLSADVI